MKNEDIWQIPLYIALRTFLFVCNFHFITCECEVLATLYHIWYWTFKQEKWDFRVNPHNIGCLNVKELPVRSWHHIWSLSDSNVIQNHNHLVRKQTLNHLAKLAKWLSCVVSICTAHLTVCYYHVTYEFQSESTLYGLPECQGTPYIEAGAISEV